jgi:hypothetical protein
VARGEAFELLTPNGEDEDSFVAELYVQLSEGRLVALAGLTEADARIVTGEEGRPITWGGRTRVHFTRGKAMLVLNELHNLSLAVFHEDMPIPLATSPDGPFFTLPITKQRMIEIFGKPLRWEKSTIPGV